MLLDRRIEGLVVLANWLFVDINVLADLEKNNIPTAIVGRELKNDSISSVIVDNDLGARAALEHLIRSAIARLLLSAARGNCRIPSLAGAACATLARERRPRTRPAADCRSARIRRSVFQF